MTEMVEKMTILPFFKNIYHQISACPDKYFRLFKVFSKHERTSVKNVTAIGKHRVKETFALSGRFSSPIINLAENNNTAHKLIFSILIVGLYHNVKNQYKFKRLWFKILGKYLLVPFIV